MLRTRLLSLPDQLAPLVYETDSLARTRDLLRRTLRDVLEDLANSNVQPDSENNPDNIGIADLAPDGETGAFEPATTTGDDDQ